MRCAFHPEVEAITTCDNCNMPVCSVCLLPVEKKNYCQSCIDEAFARHWAKPGAILGMISGVSGFAFGFLLTCYALLTGRGSDDALHWGGTYMGHDWVQGGFGIALMLLGCLAMMGSRYALLRERYNLAVAGGICAAVCMPLLGVPALMLIRSSREEFDANYAGSCQTQSILDRIRW